MRTCPEQAFLENDVIISPANMADCLLTRTSAIIDCLHVALNGEESELMKATMTALLWQVSGNLDELHVVDRWEKPTASKTVSLHRKFTANIVVS